jgi:hypothetical protein
MTARLSVIAGLDPAIHPLDGTISSENGARGLLARMHTQFTPSLVMMDCRVKPGNDGDWIASSRAFLAMTA